MKISKLQKDIDYGMNFARAIRLTSTREEMRIVRCILCQDVHNVCAAMKYLNVVPERYNKPIQLGIFLGLTK